jgi:hypothetical protein
MLDVTGILGAGAIAAMGLYVLPYRRSRIKKELRDNINDLRTQLDVALTKQFDKELADSVQRIRDAIAPYTRFVRVEREKLERLSSDLQETGSELAVLRSAVQNLGQVQVLDREKEPEP